MRTRDSRSVLSRCRCGGMDGAPTFESRNRSRSQRCELFLCVSGFLWQNLIYDSDFVRVATVCIVVVLSWSYSDVSDKSGPKSHRPSSSQYRLHAAIEGSARESVRQTAGTSSDVDAEVERIAIRTLCEFNQLSVDLDREFGGQICRRDGAVFAMAPRMGAPDQVFPSVCAKPDLAVGEYHTHARNGNEGPSGNDAVRANSFPFPLYVSSPSGVVYRYRGPNADRIAATRVGSCDGKKDSR